jgi:hypothetical protein
VSICYHPHAYDAQRFGAQSAGCSTALDLFVELADCTVDDPKFGWSIDGTPEGDIVGTRVHPDRGSVSMVEYVRSALDPAGPVEGHAEARRLLGYVSEVDGRLVEEEFLVGYLLPDEIRRVSTLLAEVSFPGSPGQDEDRLLLLRLFTIALKDDRGLYWTWL